MEENETKNNRIDIQSVGNSDNTIVEWDTPEFINHERSPRWFLYAGTILLILIGYAVYTGSATMAIVFVVLGGLYYLTHNQEPKVIKVQITDMGIRYGEKFYPYNQINSYWMVYHPPYVRTLNLVISDKSKTRIVIQLDSQDPAEVRKALAREIPEIEGAGESMSEILIRLLRL